MRKAKHSKDHKGWLVECIDINNYTPAGADTFKVIMYLIKYRKTPETEWHSVPETSSTSVTVSHLYSYTHYEITVAAKYQGGEFGPASDPLKVKTKCGKCWFKAGVHLEFIDDVSIQGGSQNCTMFRSIT